MGRLAAAGEPCELYDIHGHYADAGEAAALMSYTLGVEMALTGHSLGRNKLDHLLKSGERGPWGRGAGRKGGGGGGGRVVQGACPRRRWRVCFACRAWPPVHAALPGRRLPLTTSARATMHAHPATQPRGQARCRAPRLRAATPSAGA
jgi:hypothetical protein